MTRIPDAFFPGRGGTPRSGSAPGEKKGKRQKERGERNGLRALGEDHREPPDRAAGDRALQQDGSPTFLPGAIEKTNPQILPDPTVDRLLDLPEPVWLDKNQREWEEFGLTRFLPDAFFEQVPFQRMEIEYIDPDAPKKKSKDYRNEF